jgi:hypothetical protein
MKLIRLVGIPDRRSRSLEDDRLICRSRDEFLESSLIAKPEEFVDREDDFGEIVDRTKKTYR